MNTENANAVDAAEQTVTAEILEDMTISELVAGLDGDQPVSAELADEIVDGETAEKIAAAVEADEIRAEAYEAQESEGDVDVTATATATPKKKKGGKKKTADADVTPKAPKAPRPVFTNASGAIKHKLGANYEAIAGNAVVGVTADDLMTTIDGSAKKVGEKVSNLFASIGNGTLLSNYTKVGIKALQATGAISSKGLYEAMKAAGYSEGTSRAQGQQMMAVLPLVGIATRTGSELTLNKDSVLLSKITL